MKKPSKSDIKAAAGGDEGKQHLLILLAPPGAIGSMSPQEYAEKADAESTDEDGDDAEAEAAEEDSADDEVITLLVDAGIAPAKAPKLAEKIRAACSKAYDDEWMGD